MIPLRWMTHRRSGRSWLTGAVCSVETAALFAGTKMAGSIFEGGKMWTVVAVAVKGWMRE